MCDHCDYLEEVKAGTHMTPAERQAAWDAGHD